MSTETRVVFRKETETQAPALLGSLSDLSPNSTLMPLHEVRSLAGLCLEQGYQSGLVFLGHGHSLSEPLGFSHDSTLIGSVEFGGPLNLVTCCNVFVSATSSGCLIANNPSEIKVLSSTAPSQFSQSLESSIHELLELAESVEFEDGRENAFTQKLAALVAKNSSSAVEKLGTIILGPNVDPEIAAQTLLCLGRIEYDACYLARSWVLQRALFSPSAKVRDAATVGLASLVDPHAVPSLVRAIEIERIHDLKIDMERVLSYLRAEA